MGLSLNKCTINWLKSEWLVLTLCQTSKMFRGSTLRGTWLTSNRCSIWSCIWLPGFTTAFTAIFYWLPQTKLLMRVHLTKHLHLSRYVQCFFLNIRHACVAVSDFKAIFGWYFFQLTRYLICEVCQIDTIYIDKKNRFLKFFNLTFTSHFTFCMILSLLAIKLIIKRDVFTSPYMVLKVSLTFKITISGKYAEIHIWFCCMSFCP